MSSYTVIPDGNTSATAPFKGHPDDHTRRVGPHIVYVKYVPGIRDEEGAYLHGDWDVDTKTIRINCLDTIPDQRATLLHELLHAIDDFWELKLGETGVRVIENALIQSKWT